MYNMRFLNKYIIECPSGYFYAGDDTPPDDTDDLESYWEVGRSPVYSCYKRILQTNGINDGLEQCYTSVMDSDNMEARVVIFEDAQDVYRVFNYIDEHFYEEDYPIDYPILTSAMRFDMENEDPIWIYLGTSKYLSNCDIIKYTTDISDINIISSRSHLLDHSHM